MEQEASVPPKSYVTPIGRRANQWSIGRASIWSVAIVPLHYGLRAWKSWHCAWPADGYSASADHAPSVTSEEFGRTNGDRMINSRIMAARLPAIKAGSSSHVADLHVYSRSPNRRLNSGLFRRRLALWASRELLPPSWISALAPKVVAGRRAIALTVIIVTAKFPETTRKMSSLVESCYCAPVFRRRYRFCRCCARLPG